MAVAACPKLSQLRALESEATHVMREASNETVGAGLIAAS
jgi:hypothetical protein